MLKIILAFVLVISPVIGLQTSTEKKPWIPGTYASLSFTLEVKPNHRFNKSEMGPRPEIKKGYWKSSGDTLFCYVTHSNKLGLRENTTLRKNPQLLEYHFDDRHQLYYYYGIGDNGPLVEYLRKK